MSKLQIPALVVSLSANAIVIASSVATHGYHVSGEYSVGGNGSWDDIVIDSGNRRLYVSHGDHVEVLNADSGKLLGQILHNPKVHGAAIAPELKRGFTSNGGDSSVTVFDTETLETLKKVSVHKPDFILYDALTQRVFPMSETITVLDAKTGEKAGEVELGGDPEGAVSDGRGKVYVNLGDKGAVDVLDARAMKVTQTFQTPAYCGSPRSLSYDAVHHLLFVGCWNFLVVLDAITGKDVGRSLICSGVDGAAFDAEQGLIFESCTEGVISVIRQLSPTNYALVDTVKTRLYSGTMAFDQTTRKIYLPAADFELVANPNWSAGELNHKFQVGTFRVLVVSP